MYSWYLEPSTNNCLILYNLIENSTVYKAVGVVVEVVVCYLRVLESKLDFEPEPEPEPEPHTSGSILKLQSCSRSSKLHNGVDTRLDCRNKRP